MPFRELSVEEMQAYEDVMDTHRLEIMTAAPGVMGLGVGYRHDNKRKLQDEIGLVVLVSKQCVESGDYKKVKKRYGPLRTNIVCMPTNDESAGAAMALAQRTQRFDSLVGGIQIGNSKLCKYKTGVIGAIVFDQENGPLGLSVQHVLGDQKDKPSLGCDCQVCKNAKKDPKNAGHSYVSKATAGDPISQPKTFLAKDQIGTLLAFKDTYDVAIFKLNKKRKVEPKVIGLPGPLNQAVKPTLGTRCEFSGTKTHTFGHIWFVGCLKGETRKQVCIKITPGQKKTEGGDSGGLWVTANGMNPIGLHTSSIPSFGYAVATSIKQLQDEFHQFSFWPIEYEKLLSDLSLFQSTVVRLPNNDLLAFGATLGSGKPVQIRKFDGKTGKCKSTKPINTDYVQHEGVSATYFGGQVFTASRSLGNDELEIRSWKLTGRENKTTLQPTAIGNASVKLQTLFQPALANHRDHLLLAYVDKKSSKLRFHRFNGFNWNYVRQLSGAIDFTVGQVSSSPAIVSFANHLFVTWIGKSDRRINLMQINYRKQGGATIVAKRKLPAIHLGVGSPALIVSPEKELVLAYTSVDGKVKAIANGSGWTSQPWVDYRVVEDFSTSSHSPNLFCHEQRVFCTRQKK